MKDPFVNVQDFRFTWKLVNSWGFVLLIAVVGWMVILSAMVIVTLNWENPNEEKVEDTQGCEPSTRYGYDHCVYRLSF